MNKFLPIEQKMIDFAQVMANQSGKSWEVFRDSRGAVDTGLQGTCADCPKFKLLVTVSPE